MVGLRQCVRYRTWAPVPAGPGRVAARVLDELLCREVALAQQQQDGAGKPVPAQRHAVLEGQVDRGGGWVALLEARLQAEKLVARVVNASISGETTAGGRSRLPALLAQHKPSHVVIELGGNDALRGLPLQMTQDNLNTMTQAALQSGARVLLVGMQVPPNYGAA